MTKHLDLMVPAMILVMAYGFKDKLWNISRKYRIMTWGLMGLTMINNGWIIFKLAENFSWLKVTPIW
jgi:hypothetical protein